MPGTVGFASRWAMWREFAVRSAGFSVDGLDVFGPGDESARLREVARDQRFQEAVTWQNPAALEHAVLNVAAGSTSKPSRMRQREEVVASYWQRYCGKNDTIGFFGPLAWGTVVDDGPRIQVRSGSVIRARSVHLEAWGVQELAAALDPEITIAGGPRTEDELRRVLEAHADPEIAGRGLAALGRLEAARDALAAAPPTQLREALAHLDATFVELTGREPVRNHGRAYGARTLAYLDCMRDLDVMLGPGLVSDAAPALETLFEAGRWYCGQVAAIGRSVVERALERCGPGPLGRMFAQVLPVLGQPEPGVGEAIEGAVTEMQRRLAVVLADPDPTTIGSRARAAFGERLPIWRHGVFSSVDLELAARDEAAVAGGDYLAVVGDVHPGGNPLIQGVFGNRHPDPPALRRAVDDYVGLGNPMLLPPFAPGMGMDARNNPVVTEGMIKLAVLPSTRAPAPHRTWLPDELSIDGEDVVNRSGDLRMSVFDVFAMPIFISGIRAFELLPDEAHSRRMTIGRTVLQREGWTVPASEIPQTAADVPAFARDRGMPRRVFMKSPVERKPMFLDTESQTLGRILCRLARKAAELSPTATIRFTEMLPAPEECWLRGPDGKRYASELRLVAVDTASAGS